MSFVSSLVFLILAVTSIEAKSDVIELNPQSFKELVLQSELPFMVKFYAPWCGHCKSLAPVWEKVATNLKGIFPIGKVDCTVHQSLCSQYSVQGYPTLKCFKNKGKVQDFQGGRDANSIIRFATSQLENTVVNVKDAASLDSFLQKSADLVHFLLFSSKPGPSDLYKSLAIQNKGKAIFGQAKDTISFASDKYSLEEFPTVIAVEPSGEVKKYQDGKLSSKGLQSFINDLIGTVAPSSEPSKESSTKPTKPNPKPSPTISYSEPDALDSSCSSAALCLVFAVDTIDQQPKTEQKEIIDKLHQAFVKDKKVKLVWLDRSKSSPLLSSTFQQSTESGPSFLIYKPKSGRYATSASFNYDSIYRLVEHALDGTAQFQAKKTSEETKTKNDL